MDFFLKRVPAFSRALGEEDSDEEPDWEDAKSVIRTECLNDKQENVNLEDLMGTRIVSRLVISLGALTTAFVTIGFQLTKRKPIGTLVFHSSESNKLDSSLIFCLYDISELDDNFYLLTTTTDLNSTGFINRTCVSHLGEYLFVNPKQVHSVTILCAYPLHYFMSKTSKPKAPFMRYLHTRNPIDPDKCVILEQPNIISGLPAEFLTYCHIHSIPASLFISFYPTNSHLFCNWAAVKEVLESMRILKQFVPDFESLVTESDEPIDEKLTEQCTTLICGGNASKTHQMYT